LAAQREAFLDRARANRTAAGEAPAIWEFLLRSPCWYSRAAAVGYHMLIFQAAYLKTYFPDAFASAHAETPLTN
jgi:DNA polymerase III alpha subunit